MNENGSRGDGTECDAIHSVNGDNDTGIYDSSERSVECIHHECTTRSELRRSEEDSHRDSSGSSEGGVIVALPTRRTKSGISRSHVELELAEHTKDLAAFKGAYSQIHTRVLEVQDEGRLMKLVNWSGTSAVMGSLELTIHAIERTVDELKDLLKRLDAGAIIDSDKG